MTPIGIAMSGIEAKNYTNLECDFTIANIQNTSSFCGPIRIFLALPSPIVPARQLARESNLQSERLSGLKKNTENICYLQMFYGFK